MEVLSIYFILSTFISIARSDQETGPLQFTAADGSCLKWECLEATPNCSSQDNKVFNLDSTTCPVGKMCYVGLNLQGTCIDNKGYTPRKLLYPGQKCSSSSNSKEWCAFGPQTCQSGYCRGIAPYQECRRSGDCNYGYYCSKTYCVAVRQIGEECDSVDACGRTGRCFFQDKNSVTGTCKKLFSLDDGVRVALLDSNDKPIIEDGIEFLCMSGWVDKKTGRCATGFTSTNKGAKCTTNADCPTNDEQNFAECRCGANATGQKYCDLMGQDPEWKNVRSKFMEYYDKTQDCHPGARYSACSETGLYSSWKCAHLRAKYYVHLLDNPPCVTAMSNQLDLWKTINSYCDNASSSLVLTPIFFGILLMSLFVF